MAQHGTPIAPILTDEASVQDMGPGGVLNQLPSLKSSSDVQRTQITSFNEYKNVNNQEYSAQHPNAQSDGDQMGRGETGPNSTVGTLTDEQKTCDYINYFTALAVLPECRGQILYP